MTTKLTKAQLVAKIDQLERELNAQYLAQRPSRRVAMDIATKSFRDKCAAARQLAITTGSVVKL